MAAHADKPLHGMAVLVVEDSWHLADALRITIEGLGGSVVGPAGSLAQAERLAGSAVFHAAVMDLNLRGSLAHGLVERLVAAGTKVVVLTGYESPQELAGKVHACLTKPIETEHLIAALIRPLQARAP